MMAVPCRWHTQVAHVSLVIPKQSHTHAPMQVSNSAVRTSPPETGMASTAATADDAVGLATLRCSLDRPGGCSTQLEAEDRGELT